jgi:beta-lactam-binding protein with PASTA domain
VPGIVIQQHPAPQKTFSGGKPVKLTVSLGPK